jgi:hypothetical protein
MDKTIAIVEIGGFDFCAPSLASGSKILLEKCLVMPVRPSRIDPASTAATAACESLCKWHRTSGALLMIRGDRPNTAARQDT